MQRVRKERVVKEKPPRYTSNGKYIATLELQELARSTSPAALKSTAFFSAVMVAIGFGVLLIASYWLQSIILLKVLSVPILLIVVAGATAFIMALLPHYFIFKPVPLEIVVYSRLIEFRRKDTVLRVLQSQGLSLTYDTARKKLKVCGEHIALDAENSSSSESNYRNGKFSLFMSSENVEKLAEALPATIIIK